MLRSLRKLIRIFGVFLLVTSTNILPLTIKSFFMVHPLSKKSVILLDDAHFCFLKLVVNNPQRRMLSKLNNHQKAIFNGLGQALLQLDSEKGSQVVVITETGHGDFARLAEEEAGAIGVRDIGEILDIFPRIFFRQIFASASEIDEKIELIKTKIKSFNNMPAASFILRNGVRWIAGDRARTARDHCLAFKIYRDWKNIVATLNAQEKIADDLKGLTIGAVKEYITLLQPIFEECGIPDPYYSKICDVINKALAAEKVKESDHFALLHQYLVESGNAAVRDELNNDMISCLSQKFDVELIGYLHEFEKDEMLNCAFIIAGSEHNNQLRMFLASQGYRVVEQVGVDDDVDFTSFIQDKTKLTAFLQTIELNCPFVNMQKILGVNVQEVQAPESSSCGKYCVRGSCVMGGCLGALYLWKNHHQNWAIASLALGALLAGTISD